MFQVLDIIEEAEAVAGFCEQTKLFRWVSRAIALIGNKGIFDPYQGTLDICTSTDQRTVSLPREVETPLGVNIGGRPTLGRDRLFEFHVNGPGDCDQDCNWVWDDRGLHCLYRDLTQNTVLVAKLQRQSDAGKSVIVYGFDEKGFPVRQSRGGVIQDGWQVPTIWNYPLPDADAPTFSRITRIQKAESDGVIQLATFDSGPNSGMIIAQMEPDELDPCYRRIRLGRKTDWVRITYRKNSPRIRSLYDRIPLRSELGFVLALRAVKAYGEYDLQNGNAYEANAARLEAEAQEVADPPTMAPIQVVDLGNSINDRRDYLVE